MAAALTTCDANSKSEPLLLPAFADKCSVAARECPVIPPADGPVTGSSMVAVITAAVLVCERPATCLQGPLASTLRTLQIRWVSAVSAIAQSETDANNSGRAALRAALLEGRERAGGGAVLVVEEGTRLHRDFAARLETALAAPRCRCQLAVGGGCPPGVLHLGMAVDTPAARRRYADGAASADATTAACANVLPKTGGGFATVYGAEAVPFALAWLDRGAGGLGELFTHLSLTGLVVRGLPEPLAIAGLAADGGGVLGALPSVREAEYVRWNWRRADFV
jgi:hypothetical protein